jgi:DNA-binding transcriptional ArsR family regulator
MGYESVVRSAPDELFKTLADPTRRALFERLVRDGEQNVRALTAQAGISQPAVSKHLGVLKNAGLVRERPSGRTVHYTAEPRALAPLVDWLGVHASFWRERFDALETALEEMDE